MTYVFMKRPQEELSMTLLQRVALAIFQADVAPTFGDWSELSRQERARYEVMASAALSVRLTIGGEDPYNLNGR